MKHLLFKPSLRTQRHKTRTSLRVHRAQSIGSKRRAKSAGITTRSQKAQSTRHEDLHYSSPQPKTQFTKTQKLQTSAEERPA